MNFSRLNTDRFEPIIVDVKRVIKLSKLSLTGDRTEYYRARVKSKIFDAIDSHFPKGKVLPPEITLDNPEMILDRMLPAEYRKDFFEYLIDNFPTEGIYGTRVTVGKGATRHPHDFIVENFGGNNFRIQFVDPEEQVGQRDNWSPRIVNMFVVDFHPNDLIELAIGRYDTSRLSAEKRSPFIKMRTLREMAPEFLKTGKLPGMPDENAYFLLHVSKGRVRMVDAHARSDAKLLYKMTNPEKSLPIQSEVRKTFLIHAVFEYLKSMVKQGNVQPIIDGHFNSVQR